MIKVKTDDGRRGIRLAEMKLIIALFSFAALLAVSLAGVLPAENGGVEPAAVAQPCNATTCVAPNCRCSSTEIPGGLAAKDTPMMILLTFDDGVNVINYKDYDNLIFDRVNPNGCPIKATYFVSHEYTNYSLVNDLYNRGYEIASHSITHRNNATFWNNAGVTEWEREMVDMRTIIEYFGNVSASSIVGGRAPFLLVGGNQMVSAYQKNKFKWDCSWPTRSFTNPGMWPYTLDYESNQDCPVGRCPTDASPGFWIAPMLDLTDAAGNPCAMLDTCIPGETEDEVEKFLEDNFNVRYNGNRSPLGLYLHSSWLQRSEAYYKGYEKFLNKISAKSDVFFVTVSEMIEWVKAPVKITSKPFGCKTPPPTSSCNYRYCSFPGEKTPFGSERIMGICNRECPKSYPWYGNIKGENPPTPWVP